MFVTQSGQRFDLTQTGTFTVEAQAIPEPASILILGFGAASLAMRKRQQSKFH